MEKIVKLLKELKTVSGEEKVNKLNDLAFALYNSEPKKTEEYAKQALDLAEEINSQKGIARSHNIIGISFHRRCDFDKALKNYTKALDIYNKIGDQHKIAASKNNIGAVYEKRGQFNIALKFYLKALRIWEEMDNKKNLSACFNNIGIIYEKLRSYKSALEYHLKSLKIKEEIGDTYGTSISLNNIGIIYNRQENNDLALEYLLKSLKIKKEIGNKHSIAVSYINIGNIYCDQGNKNKVMEYFMKALKSFEEINDKFGITTTNTSIGVTYIELQNFDLAAKYLKRSVQLSNEIGAKGLEAKAISSLSILYEKQSEFEQAFQYYKKASILENEIFNKQKSEQIAEMQTRYETEKKEKEAEIFRLKNVELVNANKLLSKEITKRKKAEDNIRISNKRIKKLNVILRHDLSNDFAVIRSALRLYKNDFEIKMLDEIDLRVNKSLKMIKRLREQESFIFSYSYLIEYEISEVINSFQNDYPDMEIEINGSGSAFADEAIYSVFENLINNAIKHGNSNKIVVSISTNDQFCKIWFKDNGTGIPNNIKDKIFDKGFIYGKEGHTGIGLFIVKQTIEGYNGTITIEDNDPNGVTFAITLRKVI